MLLEFWTYTFPLFLQMPRTAESPVLKNGKKTSQTPQRAQKLAVIANELRKKYGANVVIPHSESAGSADYMEAASAEETVQVQAGQAESQDSIQQEAMRALQKLQDGTFGRCDECLGEIPLGRMGALPYATMCIHHAQKTVSNDTTSHKPSEIDRDNAVNMNTTEAEREPERPKGL